MIMNRVLIIVGLFISLISCESPTKIQDFVVIGGGLMGSSAGWQLSKNGAKVLLIEQQDSIYTFGSSFGESRISRSLGAQGDIMSFLQQRSVVETKELIEYLNESDSGMRHFMEDIYQTSPVTYIRYKSQKEELNILLQEQQDTYEYAPDRETARTLLGMEIPDSVIIIREYKQYSGTLNPKILISKLHKGITHAGSIILYNEKVISLKKINELYEIEIENTKTGKSRKLRSKKIVAAAGPYNGELTEDIAPYFKELIKPKRLFLAFLKINSTTFISLSSEQRERINQSYPVADISSEIYYSMIENQDEDGQPILKVGGHFLRTEIENQDEVWDLELTENEVLWSKTNTIRYLQMLNLPIKLDDLEFVRGYSCVYSLTKSEVPYVTQIVDKNNQIDKSAVLVGGMSGIGAKGSLTYGLMAADLLLKKNDTSTMYQKTKEALSTNRLLKDISEIN
jgi:glycine/D-amino acid oxidase-like deaminating enzyme